MKKILLFSVPVALAVVLAFSCSRSDERRITNETQKKQSNMATVQSSSDFTMDVGRPIPADSGHAWIRTYNNRRSTESTFYILPFADIKRLLVKDSCIGIIYYHGFDGNNWIVLPYGITAEGNFYHTDSIATQNGKISWDIAKQYILAYQKMNPGAVKAHFFGSQIHYRMERVLGVKDIRFQIAFNTLGEQLLMSDANQIAAGEYEDASRPCPPYSPPTGGIEQN